MNSLVGKLDAADLPSKDDKRIITFQFHGFVVYLGLNAMSNDAMIAGHAHENCIWFHADAAKGSHVILCVDGKGEPADEVVKYAAEKAIKYSKSECSSVRYARLRDVYKPENTGPGVWRTRKYLQIES